MTSGHAVSEVDTMHFNDKVVVITGAGRGLGRAYALRFASLGARVVVNDVNVSSHGTPETADEDPAGAVVQEILDRGGVAVANRDSVATEEGGRAICAAALDAFGRIDIVINNAGFLRDRSFGKMTTEEWESVLKVHLFGSFYVTHACWNQLKANAGAVVFTSSHAGLLGQFGQANYAAAKAGLVGLTLTLAEEGRRYGVRVNAVAPLATTRLSELANDDLRAAVANFDPEYVATLVTYLCAGRETGGVFMAGNGRYSRFVLHETQPICFDHVPSMEEVAARWHAIGPNSPTSIARMPHQQ